MLRHTIKPILAGILAGALVFFTGPLLLIILVLKFIFTPFGMARWRGSYWGGPGHYPYQFAHDGQFADRIRNMSDAEYAEMKEKMQHRYAGCHHDKRPGGTEQTKD